MSTSKLGYRLRAVRLGFGLWDAGCAFVRICLAPDNCYWVEMWPSTQSIDADRQRSKYHLCWWEEGIDPAEFPAILSRANLTEMAEFFIDNDGNEL
jgi:hypothetical protein